jgi:hypothetical protein
MRLLFVLIALSCWNSLGWSEEDPEIRPFPTLATQTWTWAALYGDASGTCVLLTDRAPNAERLDLIPGKPPLRRSISISAQGLLSSGGRLAQRGQTLLDPQLPLQARWALRTWSDGVDHASSCMPIPTTETHPMRAILLARQEQDFAQSITSFQPSSDGGRSIVDDGPLPCLLYTSPSPRDH